MEERRSRYLGRGGLQEIRKEEGDPYFVFNLDRYHSENKDHQSPTSTTTVEGTSVEVRDQWSL